MSEAEGGTPRVHTEGESNTSPARAKWRKRQQGGRTAELVARDAEVFLKQSLSTPVMSAIAKAVSGCHMNGFLFFRLGRDQ